MKVADLMTPEVFALHTESPLIDAEELMGLRRVRHLPVVEGGRLVGLVTHRDLLRAALPPTENPDRITQLTHKSRINVQQIMHRKVRTVGPTEDLAVAARILHEGKYGCLPVVDEAGALVGILTEADFVLLAATLLEAEAILDDAALKARLEKG